MPPTAIWRSRRYLPNFSDTWAWWIIPVVIRSGYDGCPSPSLWWVLVCALAGCGGPETLALSFALGGEALPEGTETVSVAVVSGREFDFGCVGPSATLPRVGVVSSTAQLVCGIDPGCMEDAADADIVTPIPVFTASDLAGASGVLIEEVPEGPVLVFLEAFDLDNRALGIGCATSSVRADRESTVAIQVEPIL